VIIAVGLNIVLGYSGQISIAQAALVALGGYSAALLVMRASWPWIIAGPAGALVATFAGALLGLLTTRVRTHYLILITLAFHVVVLLFIVNWSTVTGGPTGLYPIPPIELGGFVAQGPQDLFFVIAVLAVLLVYAAERLRRSRVGLAMFAIRSSEKGAQASGINPAYYRVLAMSIGGFYAGVGGVLFAGLIKFLGPESFSLTSALFYIVIVVLGGMGSTAGVVVVGVVLTVTSQQLQNLADYWILIYGVLVMLVMALAPGGLAEISKMRGRLRSRPAPPSAVPPT
jgi:branched-chain amino acid transport system permease protein